MDKKRALICSVILCSLGVVTLIPTMAGPDAFPRKSVFGLLAVLSVMFLLGGFIMLGVYARLKKKEIRNAIQIAANKPPYAEEEFLQWLQKFEPYVRMGAKLTETPDKTFTKFGGLPTVPENFVWPTNGARPIPFLLQVDFSEINPDGRLDAFPTKGLLYLFADSDEINDPTWEDGEEEYAQGKAFQFLFFDAYDNPVAQKPELSDTVYKEFYVSANIRKTYPDLDDCKEAVPIYCDRPFGGADDGYDALQAENSDAFMIGGWATYIQSSRFLSTRDPDEWVLLMQITSVTDDDKFMWGDGGMLYFYIRKDDLLARRFDNVKLDMQCY